MSLGKAFAKLVQTSGWLLLGVCTATGVHAHDIRPVVVTISESLPGIFQERVQFPADVIAQDNEPVLVWPAGCAPVAADDTTTSLMHCDGEIAGRELRLEYPQANPALATFFRFTRTDGSVVTAMLPPDQESWLIPAAMGASDVAMEYLLLGIEHIIGGLDHLLFVLGLLVIARTPGRILLTVTGFTLAHSLTLSLSSLGLVSIPIVPVEGAIALSILFLAHEISRHDASSLTYRYPLLVSFGFGLLHGLGFASALGEIGLVESQVFVSLLFFNLGVEAGQVLFILAVMGLMLVLRWLFASRNDRAFGTISTRRADLAASYVIGVPSAYWLVERVAQFML